MRHDIRIAGPYFALRPVRRDDAALIVRLRRDPVHARFLHAIDASVEAQEAWLDVYFERANDCYFVVENPTTGEGEALIAIYEMTAGGTAEFGRWVVRPGSLAAVESILLVYEAGFEVLGLREMYCRTVAENRRAVSFHDSCGLKRRVSGVPSVLLGERRHDLIEHYVTRTDWPALHAKLAPLARSVA